MSFVTCWPPTGMTSAKSSAPSWNTAIAVVPPPMSITVRRASLVLDQRCLGRRIGSDDEAGHLEMTARDRQRQIAHGAALDGDHIEVDAERLAEHAERALHALGVVEGKRTGVACRTSRWPGLQLLSARAIASFTCPSSTAHASVSALADGSGIAAVRPRH